MSYWWVNQKQTWNEEVGDGNGYLWSPKRTRGNIKQFSYEFMRALSPGDIVYSYANTTIKAVGVVKTHSFSFPKPSEFRDKGSYWSVEGWRANVDYSILPTPIRVKDRVREFKAMLPKKYSPIQAETGNANQAYLFEIDELFAEYLNSVISLPNQINQIQESSMHYHLETDHGISEQLNEWEDRVQTSIDSDETIPLREKQVLTKARIGQGKFRELLLERERKCRVTGVDKSEHLIASHIKPWRSSNNIEKVDPENGFMLTPTIDHLFDKGFITFENDGKLILSDVSDREVMTRLGVIGADKTSATPISSEKLNYLDWHRENIFL